LTSPITNECDKVKEEKIVPGSGISLGTPLLLYRRTIAVASATSVEKSRQFQSFLTVLEDFGLKTCRIASAERRCCGIFVTIRGDKGAFLTDWALQQEQQWRIF